MMSRLNIFVSYRNNAKLLLPGKWIRQTINVNFMCFLENLASSICSDEISFHRLFSTAMKG